MSGVLFPLFIDTWYFTISFFFKSKWLTSNYDTYHTSTDALYLQKITLIQVFNISHHFFRLQERLSFHEPQFFLHGGWCWNNAIFVFFSTVMVINGSKSLRVKFLFIFFILRISASRYERALFGDKIRELGWNSNFFLKKKIWRKIGKLK